MYFVVFVTDKPGVEHRRGDLQDAFSGYLRSRADHPDVTVHHGGPTLADDGVGTVGLLMVVEAPSRDAVQAFLDGSPFGKADIFADIRIRQWDWRTGRPG